MIDCNKSKRQLIEELEHFRTLFNNAPLGYQSLDESGNFIDVNETWCRILGYSKDEVIGKNFSEFVHPDFSEHFKENFPKFKSLGYIVGVEIEMSKKDGSEVIVSFQGKIGYDENGSFKQTHCILTDITKCKQIEEAHRESEEKFRFNIEGISDGFITLDNNLVITYFNNVAEKLLGRKSEDVLGYHLFNEAFPEGKGSIFEEKYTWAIKEKKFVSFEIYFGEKPYENWYDVRVYPREDGISVYFQIITERKQAEEALRESEHRLSFHLRNTPVAVIEWNLNFEVVEWNPAAEKMFGYTKNEALGKHAAGLIVPEPAREHVNKVWNDLVENKGGYHSTNENFTGDGRVITCEWNNTPLVDKYGNISGVASLVQDVTERKLAEKNLRKSEEKFRNVADYTYDWEYWINPEGAIVYISPSCERITGYSPEEFIQTPELLETIIHSDDAHLIKEHKHRIFESGDIRSIEYRIIAKNKDIRWIDHICQTVLDAKGMSIGQRASNRDITEQKKAEEALAEASRIRNILLDTLPNPTMLVRSDRTIVYANQAAREAGALVGGICWRDFRQSQNIPDADREYINNHQCTPCGGTHCTFCEADKAMKSGQPVSLSDVHTSGKIWDMYWIPLDDDMYLHFIYDITDIKQTEKALRESEARLRVLFEKATEGIMVCDIKGRFIQVNERAYQLMGYTKEELLQLSVADIDVDVPNLEQVLLSLGELPLNHPIIIESRHRKKDGATFPVEITIARIETPEGIRLLGIVHDITERKLSEEALREREERHRRLFEQSNDAIFVHSIEGEISEVNNCACELTGYNRTELLAMTLFTLYPKDELENTLKAIETVKKEGLVLFESKYITADNDILNIDVSSKLIDKDTGLIQSIVRDITETKRLQELESRAERLEMAGTIAGQVAHDFNNLLAPLMAYPEFIREELPQYHNAHAYLDSIEKAARQIADINQDLLTMGRRGHYNQEVLDLNQVVLQVAQETGSRSKTISWKMDLCKDLMKIKGGESQLYRMLINLLHNAKDAMRNIGQITIKTENYYFDDVSIVYGLVPKGEYVKLTVSDTGCGIPDDIVQKIFDPFFSSKTTDKKRGSGLGMSVVDAVVKDHNGYIDLSTKIGQGTSFYIYFPIAREDAVENESMHPTGGTETVLVVDDDEIQREVSLHLLTRLGYKVTCVESGEMAIEAFRENPQDIMILDMVMPGGIDGTETYKQILEINPHQKAIVLSGFSESERVLEVQRLGAGAFVRKPISKNEIAAAVRTELDREVEVPFT